MRGCRKHKIAFPLGEVPHSGDLKRGLRGIENLPLGEGGLRGIDK